MVHQYNVKTLANALTLEERKSRIMSLDESALRLNIKSLLQVMIPDSVVEITHKPQERGKDLVIVQKTRFGTENTAVVVKTGNIGGQTMGEIPAIEDQVKQCFEFPATLSTIAGELNIDKVWVMIGGTFSGGGHERLSRRLSKVSTAVRIYDVTWLAEQFTDLYPQAFFEGVVIDFINEKIMELESRKLVSKCSGTLSVSWVNPIVASIDDVISLNDQSLPFILERKRLPFSDLKKLMLHGGRNIILSGDPGTGKSTAISKIALDLYKEAFNKLEKKGKTTETVIDIPMLIVARDLIDIDKVSDSFRIYIPDEKIRERFRINIILIDGLDEIPYNLRAKIIEKASELSKVFNCNTIVTSRKVDIIKNPITGYERYELLPFDLSRAIEMVNKLVSDQDLLNIIREGLENIRFQVLFTPLSLSLLVEIVENFREIPASLTELYDRFTDIALGRFDKEKGIQVLYEYEIKKRFLATLAYTLFYERNILEISKSDFDTFLSSYGERYLLEREKLEEFLHEIERSGILGIEETVVFCHRSFLDYFAAYYIYMGQRASSKRDLDNLVTKLYYSNTWDDIAFFYVGLNREIDSDTVENIFSYKDTRLLSNIDRFLIGRLLQAGWHSTSNVKIETINRLLPLSSIIRQQAIDIIEKQPQQAPQIFGDILVMSLCEISLVSGFIEKEERLIFKGLSEIINKDNLYFLLILLNAFKKFLSKEEISSLIDKTLDIMSQIKGLTPEEQARMFLILSVIERKDPKRIKFIRRKLISIWRRHPEIQSRLLPQPKPGFRKKRL